MGRRSTEIIASLLVASGFVAIWVAFGSTLVESAKDRDFLNLYVGATLAQEGRFSELHDQAAQLAVQQRHTPEATQLWPFVRPPFYALLLSWLRLFAFDTAFGVWLAVQISVMIACWIWAVRRFGISSLIFSAMYLPLAIGIAHGQDCAFMLAAAVGAYELLTRGRPGWAGAILALSLFKFHLLLLFPVVLWAAGERKMLRGYLYGAVGLTAFSMALVGATGVENYLHLLTDPNLQGLHPSPERTLGVFGLAYSLPAPRFVVIPILLLGLGALAAPAIWKAPRWRWWASGLIFCLMAVPHVYGYDAGVALMAVWLVFQHSSSVATRLIASIAATPLPYFAAILAPALLSLPTLVLLALLGSLAWESRRVAEAPVSNKARGAVVGAG